ncbi:hypothetical protein CYMTET_39821 [Cymbomonas tetramitiformis]|uniref:Ketoreductase domain-containing protein n=1 Tax=Cymbomonas tetramitiformis TaxID=36881 RepID=A0AAE0C9D6_9CHLO|nr:hypothetical protein CYMTET_39821 [Cymbomonas tetramitiformis]
MKLVASVVFVVMVAYGIHLCVRKEFPVHSSGGVVITGASSGIGLHAAQHLAKKGYRVYATVRRPIDVDKLSAFDLPLLNPIIMDVTDAPSIDKSVKFIISDLAAHNIPLVALVNNAGAPANCPVELTDLEDARANFEVNYFGVLAVTQRFLPLLRETGKGARVVMVSSLAGLISSDNGNPYSATKFALEALSEALRYEVAHFGISVSVINPAYVETAISKKSTALKDKSRTTYTSEQLTLYNHVIGEKRVNRSHAIASKGDSPEVTTTAITDAICSPYPQVRYIVANVDGTPAWIFAYMKYFLPERLTEKIVLFFNEL